jgi:hypothetical protein
MAKLTPIVDLTQGLHTSNTPEPSLTVQERTIEDAMALRPRVETPAHVAARLEDRKNLLVNNLPVSIHRSFLREAKARGMSSKTFLAWLMQNAGIEVNMLTVTSDRRRRI